MLSGRFPGAPKIGEPGTQSVCMRGSKVTVKRGTNTGQIVYSISGLGKPDLTDPSVACFHNSMLKLVGSCHRDHHTSCTILHLASCKVTKYMYEHTIDSRVSIQNNVFERL